MKITRFEVWFLACAVVALLAITGLASYLQGRRAAHAEIVASKRCANPEAALGSFFRAKDGRMFICAEKCKECDFSWQVKP